MFEKLKIYGLILNIFSWGKIPKAGCSIQIFIKNTILTTPSYEYNFFFSGKIGVPALIFLIVSLIRKDTVELSTFE